ncbi:hypothetical protein PR048_033404 [Dryococelus australis]|uniref:Uncharacterized protein n=1 Tax=Dryococelus australis TaxID=614101 RepID=A0ABQ9G070_9NEOP|nr:hypothetical protein PR048_033404 [Dryococelus australis]
MHALPVAYQHGCGAAASGRAVSLLASHRGELSSIPSRGHCPGFSPCGNHAERCRWSAVFSRGSPVYPRLFIPVLLHTHLISHPHRPNLLTHSSRVHNGDRSHDERGGLTLITRGLLGFKLGGNRCWLADPLIGCSQVNVTLGAVFFCHRASGPRRHGDGYVRPSLPCLLESAFVVGQLATHLGEPGSIPGGGRSWFFTRGNRVGKCRWRVFSGISHFPSSCIPALLRTHHSTLIGSQDLDVKSRSNVFTRSSL